jgi:hypothetical protein
MMITHFINGGSSVSFGARYYDSFTQKHVLVPNLGQIGSADYNGATGYKVLSVTENGTMPIFTLSSGSGSFTVTENQLFALKLHLFTNTDLSGQKAFDVMFNQGWVDSSGKRPVVVLNMLWRVAGGSSWYQYCVDSSSAPDQMVFQQGMAIDPVTAAVTRDSTTSGFTTLSCRKGGPATVHWWGYAYKLGYKTFYFDAGLHMKRASYCGDDKHYTVSGTQILIDDSAAINSDAINHVEAYWNEKGAICVNMPYRRYLNNGFTGWCGGVQLPDCSAQPSSTIYLDDGAVSKQ